jgi:uncharacterized protein YqjF (DUF2071 family)
MVTSPQNRVFLSAHWRWLVMLNWEVEPALLQRHLPYGTELDFFNGSTFVSIVGFLFQKTRLLGLPIPGHTHFEELNLRFYVRRQEQDESRRGVAFISELVPKRAIAVIARRFYNENYLAVPMKHDVVYHSERKTVKVRYDWKSKQQWNHLRASADAPPKPLVDGSLEQFIAEHYWGYSQQRDGSTFEYRVQHLPWQVWPAAEVEFACDVRNLYGEHFQETLSRQPDSSFIADGSPVTVSFPRRIK